MEDTIFTNIYHGGILSEVSVPTYIGNCVPALKHIIKDHFSILELLYYTKELGYEIVRGFYVKDLLSKLWVLITSDQHLLQLIKDLKHEDTYEVFVCHVLDEPLLDIEGPTGYITNNSIVVGEAVDLGGQCKVVNLGEGGEVVNLGGEGVDDNLDLGDGSGDGSDIDEELRDFRQDRRNKKQRKKATKFEEIPVGEAGETKPRKNLFVYFYVCFHAFKQGWLEGCRSKLDLMVIFSRELVRMSY
ncbi:hypothetical protein H5410_051373 [Solanum commersonii]|uniref:PB1-like domain-containing protein n=1 Tax=Solanum commersonii TaxID=4109 RepID=A0A9J5WY88_SOLCO|nr:hypothetical protein H5410_051373 [Solanum commersonii]